MFEGPHQGSNSLDPTLTELSKPFKFFFSHRYNRVRVRHFSLVRVALRTRFVFEEEGYLTFSAIFKMVFMCKDVVVDDASGILER